MTAAVADPKAPAAASAAAVRPSATASQPTDAAVRLSVAGWQGTTVEAMAGRPARLERSESAGVRREGAALRQASPKGDREARPLRQAAWPTAQALSVEQAPAGRLAAGGTTAETSAVGAVASAPPASAAVTGAVPRTAAMLTPPPEGGLSEQIAESVRASGARLGQQIIVQLHPPELGRVRIVFQKEGDTVRGLVRVENPETQVRLEREAMPLVQRLQSAGVEIRRIDVMLSDGHSGDARSPVFQEGQGRHEGGDAGAPPAAAWSAASAQDEVLPDASAADGAPAPVGGSINVRV